MEESVDGMRAGDMHPDLQVQDEAERRQIRAKYRELITDSTEQKDDVGILAVKLSEANKLFQHVEMAREARLDSQVMNVCAATAIEKTHALHTGFMQFSNTMFLDKIKQRAQSLRMDTTQSAEDGALSTQDWISLGKDASHIIRRAPTFHLMLGALEFEQPERAPRAARQRKAAVVDPGVAKAVVPDKVKELGKSDQETTTEEVERVLAILRNICHMHNNDQPICYFEFVMNPKSFEQTVENIFYVSFLIKDGLASLSLDDKNLPIIAPVVQNDDTPSVDEIETVEMALGIAREDWQEIIDTFEIKMALIPPRDQ